MLNKIIKIILKSTYPLRYNLNLTASNNRFIFFAKQKKNETKKKNNQIYDVILDIDQHYHYYYEIVKTLNHFKINYIDLDKVKVNEELFGDKLKLIITDKTKTNLFSLYNKNKVLFLYNHENINRKELIYAKFFADHVYFFSPFKNKLLEKYFKNSFQKKFFKKIFKNNINKKLTNINKTCVTIFLDELNYLKLFKISELLKIIQITDKKHYNINIITNQNNSKLNKIDNVKVIHVQDPNLKEIISNTDYFVILNTCYKSLELISYLDITKSKIIHPKCDFFSDIPSELSIPLDIKYNQRIKFFISYWLDLDLLPFILRINHPIPKIKNDHSSSGELLRNEIFNLLIYEGIITKKLDFITNDYFEKKSNIEVYVSTSNRFEFFVESINSILNHSKNSIHNVNINIFIDKLEDERYFQFISENKLNYTITNESLGLPYLMRLIKFECYHKNLRLEKKIDYVCYIQDDCLLTQKTNYFDDFVKIYRSYSSKNNICFLTGFRNGIHPGYQNVKIKEYDAILSNTIDGKNFFVCYKKFQNLGDSPYYNKNFLKNGNPGPNRGSNFDIWLWRDSKLKSYKNLIMPDYVNIIEKSKSFENSTWGNSELDDKVQKRVSEGRIYK